MKSPVKLHAQHEMDEDILSYIRGMQGIAPIREESVYSYVRNNRRRKVLESDVLDRLNYLGDKGYLKLIEEWVSGEGDIVYYYVTADGRDVLDGVKPWK